MFKISNFDIFLKRFSQIASSTNSQLEELRKVDQGESRLFKKNLRCPGNLCCLLTVLKCKQGMVAHTLNPSTEREAEANGSLNSRLVWSTPESGTARDTQ